MSTKGSEDGRRGIKSKQSDYSTSQHDEQVTPKKIEPPQKKEEKKVIQIKKSKQNPMDKGNFVKSKQMTFGQDKKLAPSNIQDADHRMWMKPGGMQGYDDSSHQTFQNQIVQQYHQGGSAVVN